jgi:hypothetical protein
VASLAEINEIARTYLRDFPAFFQATFEARGRTYQLGHVNIDPDSLWVAYYPQGVSGASVTDLSASDYSLDSRNGILRLSQTPSPTSQLIIEGYYYEWVTPKDLNFYCERALIMHLHNLDSPLENLSSAVVDVIGLAAIIETLWALMTEYSRDIDIITSESVHIPASQRFRMVQSLLSQWEAEYKKKAQALNIGLDRIEVFNLRRVSRTTNRLVPLYKNREFGDYSPMERLWSPMDKGYIVLEEEGDNLREDVYIDGSPPAGQTTTAYY